MKEDFHRIIWTYRHVRKANRWLFFTLALSSLVGVLHIVRAALFRTIINKLVLNVPVLSWKILWMIVLLLSLSGISVYLLNRAVGEFANTGAHDFKRRIATQLIRLKMTAADKVRSGDLISTFNTDAEDVQALLRQTCTSFVSQPLIGIAAATYLFTIHPLYCICLIYVPLGMYIAGYLNRRMGLSAARRSDSLGRMLAHVHDTVSGIEIVKTYNQESHFIRENTERTDEVLRHDLSLERNHSLMQPACLALARVPGVLLVLVGGTQIFRGTFDIGALIAATDLLALVLGPVVWFPFMMNGVRRSCGAVGRIRKFLELPTESLSGNDVTFVADGPVVRFAGVGFSYSAGGEDSRVLRDIDFELHANTVLAIVGESGGGKSTVVDLICGLYGDYSGSIRLFGSEIAELDPLSLRRHISVVSQRVELFPGTIGENITGSRILDPESDERLVSATRDAFIHHFIQGLPGGFGSTVAEGGEGFSGGEKLRLSIARALYRGSPLLIFDEPTAALDSDSEEAFLDTISRLRVDHTIMLISHRPPTFRIADQAIVIENGRIVQRGAPIDLLAEDGPYASLCSGGTGGEERYA